MSKLGLVQGSPAASRSPQRAKFENLKDSINWDGVFGNLGEQSISSLQYALDKVKAYFESNKGSMKFIEIKDIQEAISKMENEIASRNPFVALQIFFTSSSALPIATPRPA